MTTQKRKVVFDLDGTCLRWQMYDAWISQAVYHGVLPKIVQSKALRQRSDYKSRRRPFGEWVSAQVEAYQGEERLRGVRVSDAEFVAECAVQRNADKVHLFTELLMQAARDVNIEPIILSGSIEQAVAAFAKTKGVQRWRGTRHPQENGYFTGGKPDVCSHRKDEIILEMAEAEGWDLPECTAVGDSFLDGKMGEVVGHFIAFNPDAELTSLAETKGWPIVAEKKDVVHMYRCKDGAIHRPQLWDMMPLDLANAFRRRIDAFRLEHGINLKI
ncbi:MAG: haloacid dehalogenase-like hydrolase [Patescibacteria group bacterium]|nr:haloacid dehalogenase-like hydrolase [Patescibacteria group bacterium]